MCDIVLTFVVMFVRFMTWYHVLSDCIGQESFVLPIWSWLVWLNLKLSKWGPLFTRTIEILAYFIWNLIHIKYIQGVQKKQGVTTSNSSGNSHFLGGHLVVPLIENKIFDKTWAWWWDIYNDKCWTVVMIWTDCKDSARRVVLHTGTSTIVI